MAKMRDIAGRLFSRLRGTAARSRYASVVQRKIESSPQAARQRRLAELGITPFTPEPQSQKSREERLIDMGIIPVIGGGAAAPTLADAEWIPVQSSNVAAVRWVGGAWGLQVKFLNGYEYEYQTGLQTFNMMLAASSKGKFVWWMRIANIPYHRLVGGKNLQTVMYPFGGEKKGGKVRYPKKAIGPFYKHWDTPGYHPPGTEQPKK